MSLGITKELEQEYNRNKALKLFFANNQAKVDAFLPLKARQTLFLLHLSKFEDLIPKKNVTTKGITIDKAGLKEDVVQAYAPICLTTRSFALKYELDDLAANMNFPESKIRRMADGEVYPFAEATNTFITNLAVPHANWVDYDITATVLSDALGIAASFRDLISAAKNVDDNVAAVVIGLEERNQDLREDVDDFTLLMSRYKKTDKDFFNSFESAKKIDDIGVHHSGIEGTITHNGAPVNEAVVTCVQIPTKKDKTDVLGHYEITHITPGSYEFTFSHAIHGSKTIIVKIEKGKIKTVDVTLP